MKIQVVISGSCGYIGSAFCKEMHARNITFDWIRGSKNPTFDSILDSLRRKKPELVINSSAFIQKSSVDLNKNYPGETIMGNVVFPSMLAHACEIAGVPLMHLSTGCLFDEAREYDETDTPLRGFDGYCGFYVGTKLLSEKAVLQYAKSYVLRIRLPFDEFSNPRNYLNKLIAYPKIYEHINSLTHRGDFAKAALDLWALRSPYGVYHCANTGQISARQVADKMIAKGIITKEPEFVSNETTGCRLSTKKLTDAGVKIRDVHEAVDSAIHNWTE